VVAGSEASAQPFTDTGVRLLPVSAGSVAWGDYDGDGDLDVVVTGRPTDHAGMASLHRNDGNGVFTNLYYPNLEPVLNSAVAWGDFDADGHLDLGLLGQWWRMSDNTWPCVTAVRRGDGQGGFEAVASELPGIVDGSLAWGDYDNDGDLDLVVAGYICGLNAPATRVYRNGGDNGFTDVGADLVGVLAGSLAWGDYDNDGDLDLALSGSQGYSQPDVSRIYWNDENVLIPDTTLAPVGSSSLAWSDYDNDGYLDLAISGWNHGAGSGPETRVYRNQPGGLAETALFEAAGPLAWGDYDNDGDPDLLVGGSPSGPYRTSLYRNDGNNAFIAVDSGLNGVAACALGWGDYDNDGDLDVILAGYAEDGDFFHPSTTRIFRNNSPVPNTPPTPPQNLWAFEWELGVVEFMWQPSTDAQTPATGLSYNLRVGTYSGGGDVFSGMASPATGMRQVPQLGNAQKRLSWTLKGLYSDRYYWSVQAVDTAWAGSAWAPEAKKLRYTRCRADFNYDGHVNNLDFARFHLCSTGPAVPYEIGHLSPGCELWTSWAMSADFDNDHDVDQADFAVMQRCYSGPAYADPDCWY
jgi:hypothetical protein